MHVENLSMLAIILEKIVKPARFGLGSWVEGKDETLVAHPATSDCGTVACAIGHACMQACFIVQGLHLRLDELDDELDGGKQWIPCYHVEPGGPSFGWDAVTEFFDLTLSQARWLFASGSYLPGDDSSPAGVAKRIRKFIATGKCLLP